MFRRSTSVSRGSSSGEAPIQTALTQRYSAILAAYLLDHQPLETRVDLRQTPNQPLETRDGRISTKTNEKTLCGGMNAEGLVELTLRCERSALPTELQPLGCYFAPQSNSQQYSTECGQTQFDAEVSHACRHGNVSVSQTGQVTHTAPHGYRGGTRQRHHVSSTPSTFFSL